ncbi:hypothetical protein PAXINDRAFT_16102 [Paxillus involutus ATCC 200175]|uniref:Uncharacterized protein n=1 Tax=Paxillus involutus ATCC 200175 TaxID=664439 RepID=A0A0C9TUK7_PAXIN|nr:hypothetical protein PAXINDRAFT_16102 [Paxillus involutus ATCC 200175]
MALAQDPEDLDMFLARLDSGSTTSDVVSNTGDNQAEPQIVEDHVWVVTYNLFQQRAATYGQDLPGHPPSFPLQFQHFYHWQQLHPYLQPPQQSYSAPANIVVNLPSTGPFPQQYFQQQSWSHPPVNPAADNAVANLPPASPFCGLQQYFQPLQQLYPPVYHPVDNVVADLPPTSPFPGPQQHFQLSK